MKKIKKSEYTGDGVFIDLDRKYNPYQNLINNHNLYLKKGTKYYFYCHSGVKARKVSAILEAYGYDTTYVEN